MLLLAIDCPTTDLLQGVNPSTGLQASAITTKTLLPPSLMYPLTSTITLDAQFGVSTAQLLLTPPVQLCDTGFVVPVNGARMRHPLNARVSFVQGKRNASWTWRSNFIMFSEGRSIARGVRIGRGRNRSGVDVGSLISLGSFGIFGSFARFASFRWPCGDSLEDCRRLRFRCSGVISSPSVGSFDHFSRF